MSISRRSKLDALKSRIDDITSDLREFVDAEQERYDSRSERWQESERASRCRMLWTGWKRPWMLSRTLPRTSKTPWR